MHTSPAPPSARLVLTAPRGGFGLALHVGQRLDAMVLERAKAGTVKLAIGTHTVTARTALPLSSGTVIGLEVVRTGPQPELRLIPSSRPAGLIAEALKTALPRQMPLAQALQQIAMVLEGGASSLPPGLREALRTLLDNLISRPSMTTPQGLKQQLKASGLFLERTLLPHSKVSTTDLKAALLRLYRLTQQAPNPGTDALRQSVEGALARIQLNQLAAFDASGIPNQQWGFDLPLWTGGRFEPLHLHIRGHTASGKERKEASPAWSVTLEFDMEPTGPFQAHLHLCGTEISAHFRTERPQTQQLIARHLGQLRATFKKAGLRVGKLDSRMGLRPTEPFPWQRVERLVDEQA